MSIHDISMFILPVTIKRGMPKKDVNRYNYLKEDCLYEEIKATQII